MTDAPNPSAAKTEPENLSAKLKAIRDKFLIPTPDKDHTDYAIITRCIETLARTHPQPSLSVGLDRAQLTETVNAWIREDTSLSTKMSLFPDVRDKLVNRILALAAPAEGYVLVPEGGDNASS